MSLSACSEDGVPLFTVNLPENNAFAK